MPRLIEYWRLLRTRQWVKSGFVFIGLLFGKAWREPRMTTKVLLAAVAFSLTASGVYIFNDLLDRAQDRNHPLKKLRPLAAQRASVRYAVVLLVISWMVSLALGFLVSAGVVAILLIYVAINIAYSLRFQHVVVLDVFIISAGFMLRILAGTAGVGIAPSKWLLLCGLMIALFLGFSKRRAELYSLPEEGSTPREVLSHYQPVLLDNLIVITATSVILTYSLYTLSPVTVQVHHTESLIYTVPFVIYGIFRYIYSLHTGRSGSDPAVEIFRDPHILFSILGWLVVTIWLIS